MKAAHVQSGRFNSLMLSKQITSTPGLSSAVTLHLQINAKKGCKGMENYW